MSDGVPSCDVVVVGAGLSGLTCAHLLYEAGLHTIVLEASERVGGRIHSVGHSTTGAYAADLGPTWVWPPYQPSVAEWLTRLNIATFAQFEDGNAVLDMDENSPVQHQPLPGQHGIRRVTGGPQALVDALSRKLPKEVVKTGHAVARIDASASSLSVTARGPHITTLQAKYVVIAVPPRVAAQNIALTPALDSAMLATMERTPSWMAAKPKPSPCTSTRSGVHKGSRAGLRARLGRSSRSMITATRTAAKPLSSVLSVGPMPRASLTLMP